MIWLVEALVISCVTMQRGAAFFITMGLYLFLVRKLHRHRSKKATSTPSHFCFVLDFSFQSYFLVNLISVFWNFEITLLCYF